MTLLLLLIAVVLLAYFSAPLWAYFVVTLGMMVILDVSVWWWIPLLFLALLFLYPPIRRELVTRPLVGFIASHGLLPRISETEKTALRAGDVWIEGELFSGKPDFAKIFAYDYLALSEEEQAFLDNEVEAVCAMVTDWEIFSERDLPAEVWAYLKQHKFFGMIIPKAQGGLGFSAYAHSCVIEKLATHSQVLAITVMVPNSLGPAELLLHYGTKAQQAHYLPRLADGREVPFSEVATVKTGRGYSSIRRVDGRRSVNITADIDSTNLPQYAGLDSEDEDIKIVILSFAEAKQRLLSAGFNVASTIIALQWLFFQKLT